MYQFCFFQSLSSKSSVHARKVFLLLKKFEETGNVTIEILRTRYILSVSEAHGSTQNLDYFVSWLLNDGNPSGADYVNAIQKSSIIIDHLIFA